MKRHFSAASPYGRKVRACAVARGLERGIEKIAPKPHALPDDLPANKPLSKAPALLTPEGVAVHDSPVICGFLDHHGDAPRLFPPVGSAARLKVSLRQATADGILDAAVARRMQAGHPQDEARRALDVLEQDPPQGLSDIGTIGVGCALGDLDFRFAYEPWRETHPRVAAWFAEVSQPRPLAETVPLG